MHLTTKQIEVLRVIAKGNPDGSHADLDEILSGPEAEPSRPSLAVSCDRLIALVRQVAGLPT